MSKESHLPESWLTCNCLACQTWRAHCESMKVKLEEELKTGNHLYAVATDRQRELEIANAKLRQFARDIISDECWDLGGSQARDGADVQEWAESMGLIVKKKATREDAADCQGLFEEGDEICKFAEILTEKG